MKIPFVNSLIALYRKKPFYFLTGDLGYNMLEPLRDVMSIKHFINAGVAEQNMVSMAAGLAKMGESVWVYSIAPFLYARAFEQIRNDICFHNLPVKLVGMGGGYGYGYLGPSHWAIDDYGILLTCPNMRVYIPAFDEDVAPIVERMNARQGPSYLRLGRCEKPEGLVLPDYDYMRCFYNGEKKVAFVGPIAGALMEEGIKTFIITEREDGDAILCPDLYIEEHIRQGSIAQIIGCSGLHAKHFPQGPYGSQKYMRQIAGLTKEKIQEALYGGN